MGKIAIPETQKQMETNEIMYLIDGKIISMAI